jgi:hypothetical protein
MPWRTVYGFGGASIRSGMDAGLAISVLRVLNRTPHLPMRQSRPPPLKKSGKYSAFAYGGVNFWLILENHVSNSLGSQRTGSQSWQRSLGCESSVSLFARYLTLGSFPAKPR